MKINHNIPAMKTLHELNKVNNKAAKSMERLSSGLRINSAVDDAAGMAIANKMDSQIRGLRQANRNAMDGISMIQTAEGATNEIHAILQRMRELSVQAANDTYSGEDRDKVQQEINQLTEEINRITKTTEFNTKSLLQGKDDASGLVTEDILFTEGADSTKVEAEFTIKNPMSQEEIQALVGKSICIKPSVEIGFVLGDAKEGQVDLSGCKSAAELAKAIAEKMSQGDITATAPDEILDDATEITIKISIDVEDGEEQKFVLADGGLKNEISLSLQVGANEGQQLEVTISDMSTVSLGLTAEKGTPGFTDEDMITDGENDEKIYATLSVGTSENAGKAIDTIDKAISIVSEQRSKLGAVQNRLEHTTANLGVSEENLTASMSRIQDADMAYEMAQFTQQNVISQAATAMLAQANQRPQQVLQLLQR